jgi:hypothetical protein
MTEVPVILVRPPAYLFKYCSCSGAIAILRDLRIKVTPPNQLNDSRELLCDVVLPDLEERLREITPTVKQMWMNAVNEGGLVGFPEISQWLERVRAQEGYSAQDPFWRVLISAVTENLSDPARLETDLAEFLDPASAFRREELPDAISGAIQDTLSEMLGIFSLSANRLHETMWGHYAENQQGAVIGFRTRHSHFKKYPPHKVVYSKNTPTVDFCLEGNWETFRNFVAAFTAKRPEWRYEREWRQVIPLEDCERQGSLYLLPIAADLVDHVIFGLRATQQFRADVIEELAHQRFRHVRCLQTRLRRQDLALEPI